MAEHLAELKKKGGGGALTETVLWTNPSPTSTWVYTQMINLSDDYTKYKYLKVIFRNSTTNSSERSVLIPTDEFAISGTENTVTYMMGYLLSSTSLALMTRRILPDDSTTMHVTTCRQVNGTQLNDNLVIPKQVIGLK